MKYSQLCSGNTVQTPEIVELTIGLCKKIYFQVQILCIYVHMYSNHVLIDGNVEVCSVI